MKTRSRIRNWPEYNAALRERGSLTVWGAEEARKAGRYTGPRQRGAQDVYTEAASKWVLTRRAVYPLAWRATEGVARSVFARLEVALPVPSSSTLARRAAAVTGALGVLCRSGPLPVGSDASGCKV